MSYILIRLVMLGRGIHAMGRVAANSFSGRFMVQPAMNIQQHYFSQHCQQGNSMLSMSNNLANHLVILNLRQMLEKTSLSLQAESDINPNTSLSVLSQGRTVVKPSHKDGVNSLVFNHLDMQTVSANWRNLKHDIQ